MARATKARWALGILMARAIRPRWALGILMARAIKTRWALGILMARAIKPRWALGILKARAWLEPPLIHSSSSMLMARSHQKIAPTKSMRWNVAQIVSFVSFVSFKKCNVALASQR